MGLFVGFMMYCLGEMTCYAPNIGGFIEMGNKYVDPAVGFAIGEYWSRVAVAACCGSHQVWLQC